MGFYKDQSITALTNAFVEFQFGFEPAVIVITNDNTTGTDSVVVSFDHVNTHMTIKPGESMTFDNINDFAVSLKYSGAAPSYRLMAIGK